MVLGVLCFLHKAISNGLPAYLYELIPTKSHQYITRNVNDIATYQCGTDAFKFSFFPWTITELNKIILKLKIRPIQFSETIYSRKLDQNLVPYTILTIHLGLNYLLD